MNWLVVVCLLVAVAALGFGVWSWARTARIMGRLERMLRQAMDGTFREQAFDESRLSSLEARMRQYLAANRTTAEEIQAERNQIQELVSDISHQTKTPVANLVLYAQLLEEQDLPPQCSQYNAALCQQAEKLQFLINALVKTSRLETGILRLTPEWQPVQPMLERAVEAQRPQAQEKKIRISLRGSEASALYDAKWTAEAVENLLDNAVKYSPEGTEITVSVQPYELFCRIDVQDQGIGIAPEEQSRIFGRFYRSPAVANQAGVGIGLYLTRQILSAEGGYLKVTSQPGQGSTFSIFLSKERKR